MRTRPIISQHQIGEIIDAGIVPKEFVRQVNQSEAIAALEHLEIIRPPLRADLGGCVNVEDCGRGVARALPRAPGSRGIEPILPS